MGLHFDPTKPLRVLARVVGQVKVPIEGRTVVDRQSVRDQVFLPHSVHSSFCSISSRFERCKFEGLRPITAVSCGAGTEISEYIDCSFDGSHFDPMFPGFSRFVRCSFRNVRIRRMKSFTSDFIDCVFTGHIKESLFFAAPIDEKYQAIKPRNIIRGNDFSGAKLVDCAFRGGIDLREQKLPTGPDYGCILDMPCAAARVKQDVLTWSEPKERKWGLDLLQVIDMEIATGQQQVFLRYADHKFFSRPLGLRFRAFLEGDLEKIAAYREQGTT